MDNLGMETLKFVLNQENLTICPQYSKFLQVEIIRLPWMKMGEFGLGA
eukprot:CAMPEP_0117067656 /NCGR_PEP_ID=MMETSP0472-20121206/47370_1 /TAXON_ID=693140 ORGANISM="Tiarina fusus, Strain LIS" /NCGR_SAMPLE_ID=MMETSP0472 /ASSEMBLY_ACC=CAM_ASM_000603 /LENGTH=47 /DNA_ID= /DNA_START= /DNA_END= /DNA_ORIENTATION=